MQTPLSALALASILAATVSGAAGAHNARSSEWFRYTMTEAVVTLDPAKGPVARGFSSATSSRTSNTGTATASR